VPSGRDERTTFESRLLLAEGTIEGNWPEEGGEAGRTGAKSSRKRKPYERLSRMDVGGREARRGLTCVVLTGTVRMSGLYRCRFSFFVPFVYSFSPQGL